MYVLLCVRHSHEGPGKVSNEHNTKREYDTESRSKVTILRMRITSGLTAAGQTVAAAHDTFAPSMFGSLHYYTHDGIFIKQRDLDKFCQFLVVERGVGLRSVENRLFGAAFYIREEDPKELVPVIEDRARIVTLLQEASEVSTRGCLALCMLS